MSSYAPVWVKQDTHRFPRVVENGAEVEVLSPMAKATQDADARAFAATMQHLKEADSRDHTVLMMQVENEVGVLGDTRDHSDAANRAFASAVPPNSPTILPRIATRSIQACALSGTPTGIRLPAPGPRSLAIPAVPMKSSWPGTMPASSRP